VQASLGSADSQSSSRVKVFSNMFVWLNVVNSNDHPDIALFRLERNLALNSYVNVIQLPSWSQAGNKFEGYSVLGAGRWFF
jgi:Trypsin